ncbi:hypothetical protein [Cryobacterium sp. TMT2-42-4]|nr:hypothetical protein [Cryobacterium sp. TMT2-42-4]
MAAVIRLDEIPQSQLDYIDEFHVIVSEAWREAEERGETISKT